MNRCLWCGFYPTDFDLCYECELIAAAQSIELRAAGGPRHGKQITVIKHPAFCDVLETSTAEEFE